MSMGAEAGIVKRSVKPSAAMSAILRFLMAASGPREDCGRGGWRTSADAQVGPAVKQCEWCPRRATAGEFRGGQEGAQ